MKNRKIEVKPQSFLIMMACIIAGPLFLYRGTVMKSNDPILMGGGMIVIALILYATQLVRIPPVGAEVEEMIDKSFLPEQKRNVTVILTNGYTGLMADSMHKQMLRFANGDLKKLKKVARAVNGTTITGKRSKSSKARSES